MPRGNPAALSLGPGYLYWAPLGTAEPTDLVTAWTAVSANWVAVGYTKTGSEFDYQISTSPVEVGEELDPLQYASDGRTASLTFEYAELTGTHMMLAANAPTSALTAGSGIVSFEPPDVGTEVRRMFGFEAEDHTERWIYRQCFQTGTAKITRAKGAANATIAVVYSLEKPATGSKLYKTIFASPGRA